MLSSMRSRSVPLRLLALLWATLQLASPAAGAVADGQQFAKAGGGAPAAHVESTSSEACPVVHAPDCAMCRYLSQNAGTVAAATAPFSGRMQSADVRLERVPARRPGAPPPNGRAPPVI